MEFAGALWRCLVQQHEAERGWKVQVVQSLKAHGAPQVASGHWVQS